MSHQTPRSYILTTAQPAENPIVDPMGRFIPGHCYAIGWISKTHIEIINPWDTEEKRYIITMLDFFKYFGQVRGIKIKASSIENFKKSRIGIFKDSLIKVSTKEALPFNYEQQEKTMTISNGEINP